MKTETELLKHVQDELAWDPRVDAAGIQAAVREGVVTLSGHVPAFHQRFQAEYIVKHLSGVLGVVNTLSVRMPESHTRSDPFILREAMTALSTQLPDMYKSLRVKVLDAEVTLEGVVDWYFQRERAEIAVSHGMGIKDVVNMIAVEPCAAPADLKGKIEAAFLRSAGFDASAVQVLAEGDAIILQGSVRNWRERQQAQRVAWSAPGVRRVDDRLVIRSSA